MQLERTRAALLNLSWGFDPRSSVPVRAAVWFISLSPAQIHHFQLKERTVYLFCAKAPGTEDKMKWKFFLFFFFLKQAYTTAMVQMKQDGFLRG